jgi:bifunctional non-homologous end joining protein LigD
MARKSKAIGVKAAMPTSVQPMLATSIEEPFDDEEWIYELKLDGYRIISFIKDGKVKLQSRGNQNYTTRYSLVVEALEELKINAVLDGEIVVLDERGHADFDALQRYKQHEHHLVYYVFDILWLDGMDLKHLPLLERKAILQSVIPKHPNLRYSDHIEGAGIEFFQQIKKYDIEGIVCKKKDSIYREKDRTKSWLKVTTKLRIDALVGGWTESDSPRHFKSLLFGWYNQGKFEFVGHAGGGYKEKEIPIIYKQIQNDEVKQKPFVNEVETDRPVHWCVPKMIIEVEFATWTDAGKIRKPAIFKRIRTDKSPDEILKVEGLIESKEKGIKKKAVPKKPTMKSSGKTSEIVEQSSLPPKKNSDSNWPELDKVAVTRVDELEIEGNTIELRNLDKHYWTIQDGKELTKADLINYYIRIAKYILPHLKNRPLSLHLKHLNPTAPGLYIKDMEGREPNYATVYNTPRLNPKKGKRNVIDYLVCNNLATLVYAINLGCIDLNPWSSTVQRPFEPDYIIIDLDPSDNDFNKAISTALAAKEFLNKTKLKAFIKTSGKTGIHICVPCTGIKNKNHDPDNPKYNPIRILGEYICKEIHELVPDITTITVSKNSRGNKLFVDFSQNDYADTIASAYSARPNGKPTVSTPLDWKELKPGLSPDQFTILNIESRLKTKGDLFLGVYNKKIAAKNSVILQTFL